MSLSVDLQFSLLQFVGHAEKTFPWCNARVCGAIVSVRSHDYDVGEKLVSRDSSRLVAMPSFCLIVGCSNDKKRRPDLSFCRVPKVITSQGEQTEILSNERRTRWLAAISGHFVP